MPFSFFFWPKKKHGFVAIEKNVTSHIQGLTLAIQQKLDINGRKGERDISNNHMFLHHQLISQHLSQLICKLLLKTMKVNGGKCKRFIIHFVVVACCSVDVIVVCCLLFVVVVHLVVIHMICDVQCCSCCITFCPPKNWWIREKWCFNGHLTTYKSWWNSKILWWNRKCPLHWSCIMAIMCFW